MSTQTPVLALKGVSKSFGAVQALDDVDFEVNAGEVVALVGDNGAGKSTLVKAIAGIHAVDSGEILFEGQPVKISGPTDAVALGIATVYQDLALCDNLDVVANLFLGQEQKAQGLAGSPGSSTRPTMEHRSHELLDSLAVTITDVRGEVGTLSGGQRQQVAIARSLLGDPKLVMLDEPTAALGVRQTAQVLALIKRLREQGHAVIVISHNLADVFEVADRIFVLRLGRRAGDLRRTGGVSRGRARRHHGRDRERRRRRRTMSSTGASETVPPVGDVEVTPPRADFLRRFLQGELGELRVLLVLALIWAVFQVQEDRFLTSTNLTNLMLQMTGVALISIGVVLVLLLGEIDLSVGAVSGLCAAVMAVLSVKHGWGPYTAIAAAVGLGALIGLFHGMIFTQFGVPSFVVTLAGLLAYQGAQLKVLGDTGTVNITDSKLVGLTGTFYSDAFGWALAIVGIAAYASISLLGRRRRMRADLPATPLSSVVIRIGLVSAAALATVAVLNADRGVPLALLILFGFVLLFSFITTRTSFGRHLYAVGGNAEAARRAGIHVDRVRVVVFMLCSMMAAVGGIMLASRLLAVNQSSGSGDLLLLAIAGPVIAGTSLFGGRGSVWTALTGGLVIQSISNGMDLLALESSWKFMVTGAVLLIAVIIDSLARRQRQAAGRI